MGDSHTLTCPRSLWRSRAFVILILGISCSGVFWLGAASYRMREVRAGLWVNPDGLDIGEVWEAKDFLWTLPIVNHTDEDIQIINFTTSCSCLSISPSSLNVPAGQTANVSLTIDLTKKNQAQGGSAVPQAGPPVRNINVEVVPILKNGQPAQVRWTIFGRARSVITLAEPALDFEESIVRGYPIVPRKMKVTASIPLEDLKVIIDPTFASARVSKVPGGSGIYEVEVVPDKHLSLGFFTVPLKLVPIGQDGKQYPYLEFPVSGTVSADVRVVPTALHFGALNIGESREEIVVLRSNSGKSYKVETFHSSSEDVVIKPADTNIPGAQAFRVTQKASHMKNSSALVRFSIRSEVTPDTPVELFLKVTYHGIRN
jgi:hypothetical protein